MDFIRRIKVDAVHQVNDVAEQIAALHAVGQALEHGGDDVAALTAGVAAQAAQIGEQAGAVGIVGQGGPFVGQEGQQVGTGEAVGRGRPIPPSVGRFDDAAIRPPSQFGAFRFDALQVVQEFQEHDPRQHRQAVQVAVQPLVLAHDPAGRLDNAVEPLRGGERLGRRILPSNGSGHVSGSLG